VLKFGDDDRVLTMTGASDNAARFIRAMIFSGQLAPGEKLPPGVALAGQLGISVVTLRIALKSLQSLGYIVTTRGAHGGTRINDEKGLTRCWIEWVYENAADLDDIFELRSTIEVRIAWLAAERRTEVDLQRMQAANDFLQAEPQVSLLPWNAAFHDALADAAHSKYLREAMVAAQGRLFLPVDIAKYEHQVDELRAAHAAILSAVRSRDASAAAEVMRADLARTQSVFTHWLESNPPVARGATGRPE
jgi:GntR family transcriptional repressor for pyruvate dehydrogenase complex